MAGQFSTATAALAPAELSRWERLGYCPNCTATLAEYAPPPPADPHLVPGHTNGFELRAGVGLVVGGRVRVFTEKVSLDPSRVYTIVCPRKGAHRGHPAVDCGWHLRLAAPVDKAPRHN
jgi:hypothetical protein